LLIIQSSNGPSQSAMGPTMKAGLLPLAPL